MLRRTVAVTALLLSATLAAPPPAGAEDPPEVRYVAVNVATVWTSPGKARPVDEPAISVPAHPARWTRAMTPEQSADLTDSNRTQTQVLYGAPVIVVGHQGGWSQVVVPHQPTPRDPRGYPGYVPTRQLSADPTYTDPAAGRFALVDRGLRPGLYADPGLRHRVLTLSANTRLPVLDETPDAIEVRTPDRGVAWLSTRNATAYDTEADIPAPTGADLVATARTFLRQPYVWAGRSAFGFDCSGLTGTVYQVHGVTIPRDSGPQATDPRARPVAVADLQPGDLLFYSASDAAHIHHVAMYVGGGRMVEAYDHLTPVRITPVRTDGDYWGAVRYLPAE